MPDRCSPAAAGRLFALLIDQYDERIRPTSETFSAFIVSMFTGYPESVVRAVVDPSTGIANRSKFFPTKAEFSADLERHMAPARAREDAERAAADRRRETQALLAYEPGPRLTMEEIRAEIARRGHQMVMPGARDDWQARKVAASAPAERERAEQDLERIRRQPATGITLSDEARRLFHVKHDGGVARDGVSDDAAAQGDDGDRWWDGAKG